MGRIFHKKLASNLQDVLSDEEDHDEKGSGRNDNNAASNSPRGDPLDGITKPEAAMLHGQKRCHSSESYDGSRLDKGGIVRSDSDATLMGSEDNEKDLDVEDPGKI